MSSRRKAFRRNMRTENRTTRKLRLSWAAQILIACMAVVASGCGGGFSLSSGAPPSVTITPSSGAPGKSLSISISGNWTHFAQGITTAGFGAGIAVGGGTSDAAGTVIVTSPTAATAQIAIDASATSGARDLVVNTGSETIVLAKGFSVLDVPVANAGLPQTVNFGATAQLDGTGSTDPGGLTLTYAWTLVSRPTGSEAVLSSATAAKPTFVADQPGTFKVQLIVSNGSQSSTAATVTITSQSLPPVANAGLPQTVTVGAIVQLDGTGSTDPAGLTLTYAWTLVSTPAGSTAVLSSATTAKPTFAADKVGSYKAQLIVSDSYQSSPAATVTITSQSLPPVANAGLPQTVALGATVQLDGTGSTDPAGLALTYAWTLVSTPTGSATVLSGATTAKPTFVADKTGSYKAQLIVSDSYQSSPAATVTITSQSLPPVANAGLPQAVTVGATVQLDGTGSTDSAGLALTYAWMLVSTPEGSTAVFSGATTAKPTFVADKPGSYKAQLIVSDGYQSSPAATVTITSQFATPVAKPGADQNVTLPYGQTVVSVTLDGSASSSADGSIATYTWSGTPTPSATAKPTLSLTPGSYIFTLTVTDSNGQTSAPVSVHVTVVKGTVHPPVITVTTAAPYTATAGSGTALNVALRATSPDGRPVTLTAGPSITNTTFNVTPGTTAAGTYGFTPGYGQQGIYLVGFTARDGYGLTITSVIQIAVAATDRPPVLVMQNTATVAEGATLTIPVSATDPDGDVVTLTATGLPAHAVLVPASGAITFSPVKGQAQSTPYRVTVTASDGQLTASTQVAITVTAATGGSEGGAQLTLVVTPIDSPSFLATQHVTGTVNGAGTAQQPQSSALISGMSPASGQQGGTLTVSLTGDTTYLTHFANGQSVANFGSGITVNSLTVADATHATASIAIDPSAAVGPRSASIVTGSETAVSVNAFNVLTGVSTVSGKLVDSVSSQAISGATVVIQGTMFSATTGADGGFSVQGAPAGAQTLIANANNYALATFPVALKAGDPFNLGTIKLNPTVFDPTAAPQVSLVSLLGRGIGTATGAISVADARSAIVDTITLVGGTEMGVLDAYGNQLNPKVAGLGKLSLQDNGVNLYAEHIAAGESISLIELLYDMRFAFQWSGTPPTYLQMLNALQTMVNQAWADPYNSNSAVVILLFNQGTTMTPDPPTLTADMRLNKFQAYIALSGLMMQMYNQGQ